MIIVGSTALKCGGIDLRNGKESDIDIIVPVGNRLYYGTEYDMISLPMDIIYMFPYTYSKSFRFPYTSVDGVYTLKLSHLTWDIMWRKHKNDCIKLEELGAKKIVKLYDALVEYWSSVNTKDHLSLYKTKSDFFDDHVQYVYDHDYLHEVVSYPDKPIYSLCLKDGQEVAIDKDKFFALPFDKQLRMFQEEITVIAAERWLIPKRSKKYHLIQAYQFSLHKTVTALTKGWASQFIIDNLKYYIRPNFSLFKNFYERNILTMPHVFSEDERDSLLKEIIAANKASNERGYDWEEDYSDFIDYFLCEVDDFESGDNSFSVVQQVGGGEGEGEYAHRVFLWNGVHYKLTYAYYSYVGICSDNAELTRVEPKQEMVTVYT